MKKTILSILVLMILSGCVTREQNVNQQIYSCTASPKVDFEIDERLKFIKRFDEISSVYAPDASHSRKSQTFLFSRSNHNDIIEEAVVISSKQITQEDVIYHLKCSWAEGDYIISNEYSKFINNRSCRLVGLAGENLFSHLGVDTNDMDVDDISGGYFFELNEIIVGAKQTSYTVAYLHKIYTPLNEYSISGGVSVEDFNKEQKAEYEKFLESAGNAYKKI